MKANRVVLTAFVAALAIASIPAHAVGVTARSIASANFTDESGFVAGVTAGPTVSASESGLSSAGIPVCVDFVGNSEFDCADGIYVVDPTGTTGLISAVIGTIYGSVEVHLILTGDDTPTPTFDPDTGRVTMFRPITLTGTITGGPGNFSGSSSSGYWVEDILGGL